jgi:hypothetical protein
MEKRFYVVEKQLEDYDGVEETNGWKTVTMYDIDAQAMNMVEVCQLEVPNSEKSVEALKEWLAEQEDENEYEFIQL